MEDEVTKLTADTIRITTTTDAEVPLRQLISQLGQWRQKKNQILATISNLQKQSTDADSAIIRIEDLIKKANDLGVVAEAQATSIADAVVTP